MKKFIKTSGKIISYNEKKLYHGRKKINKKIAQKNLLVIRNILIKTNIRWGIIFGTLLGAIREKNFIAHDEDTDIFVLYEDKKKLIDLIYRFMNSGFKIARYEENSLLSIIKKNEYIDFYLFKKKLLGRRCLDYYIPEVYFEKLKKIKLFNYYFPTLNKAKEYLVFQYGQDWKVSKKNNYAKPNIYWKKVIKKLFPKIVNIYHFFKL